METTSTRDFDVDDIFVGERMRALDPTKVRELASSMATIGLLTPITVHLVEKAVLDGEEVWKVPALVAGAHRLAAAKELGWREITCHFVRGSDIDFRLAEIAENLHRADLTVEERAEHVAEWVRITAQKAPQGGEPYTRKDGKPLDAGISRAARQLPVPGNTKKAREHAVERAVKIAGIAPEAKEAAREAGLADNQSALLVIAKEPTPDAQVAKARQLAAEKKEKPKRQKAAAKEGTAPAPMLQDDDPVASCIFDVRHRIMKFLSLLPTEDDRESMFIHLRQVIDNLDAASSTITQP